MYLVINNQRYSVSKRVVESDTIRYYTVSPKPENVTGNIEMFTNEGVLMSTDNADGFARKLYSGTLFTITNKPEPIPPQPKPDTRTAAQKRQDAYASGQVGDKNWTVIWQDKKYTCDELSQLGMRYAFRNETAIADEIRALAEAKVNEIRAFYPDEN